MKRFCLLLTMLLVIFSSCRKVDVGDSTIVQSITISDSRIALLVDETAQLTVHIKPASAAGREVTWTSSNPSVATVDNGLVTAKKVGETTIKVSVGSQEAFCEVEVVPIPVHVTGLSIVPQEVSLVVGGTEQLQLVFTPSNATNRKVQWYINKDDDKEVASISAGNVVTGKKKGKVTFTAVSEDNDDAYASVSVSVVDPFTSVSIPAPEYMPKDNSGNLILIVGDELQLRGVGTPSDSGDLLQWKVTSGDNYATVTASGVLKCTAAGGTVTVEASSMADPGIKATCKFKTYSKVTDIRLVPNYNWAGTTRPTEYIGFGKVQKWKVVLFPSSACQDLEANVSGFSAGNGNFTMSSFSTDRNVLTVTAPSTGNRISKKDSKCSGSTMLSCYNGYTYGSTSYFRKELTFSVSLYDPFEPKPGDQLYVTGSGSSAKLIAVDGGYRGYGIFDNKVGKAPSSGYVYAYLGYVGEKHINDDPDFTPTSQMGITGMATDNNGVITFPSKVHGVGLAPSEYVIRDPNVVIKYGDEGVWPLGRRFVNAPYFDAEMWSYDRDDVAPSDALIRMPANLAYTEYKMSAYHNTRVLAAYNEGRGSSHAVKPAIYTGFTSSAHDNYIRFYYGGNGQNINDNTPVASCTSPWLLPTIADMQMIFHGSLFSGARAWDDEAADRVKLLPLYRETWLSQEGSKTLGCYFGILDEPNLFWAFPNKNDYRRIIPIVYF